MSEVGKQKLQNRIRILLSQKKKIDLIKRLINKWELWDPGFKNPLIPK
jgi:hypothetical protein